MLLFSRDGKGFRLSWLAAGLLLAGTATASALSEIKQEDQPVVPGQEQAQPDGTVPLPGEDTPALPDGGADEALPVDPARPDVDPEGPPPEIVYNLDRLPESVRRMHRLLLEAARSGEIEKLRPLIEPGDEGTQLSFGGVDGDPIEFLKGLSGDPDGQEILAIMEEVLSAGYVRLEVGTPNELYVWPYFFAMPLDRLTPPQRVELFKIVTAGDYEDMKTFGTYIFYRLGIDPEGRWAFFVAGD